MSRLARLCDESKEDRARRWRACDAFGVPRQTRFVTCIHHGQTCKIEDAYEMNNLVRYDDGDWSCAEDHPHCIGAYSTPQVSR